MVFENQTNLFFSPLLLLRASLCLFLCKKWDEITKQHQTLKMCENVFTWSITGVTRRWTLGAANFCFLPSWKCLNFDQFFFFDTLHMEKDFWIQIKPIKISTLRGRGLLITYWQTSSSLVRLKSFLKVHNYTYPELQEGRNQHILIFRGISCTQT